MTFDDKVLNLKLLQQRNSQLEKSDFNDGITDGIELSIAILEERAPNCIIYRSENLPIG